MPLAKEKEKAKEEDSKGHATIAANLDTQLGIARRNNQQISSPKEAKIKEKEPKDQRERARDIKERAGLVEW